MLMAALWLGDSALYTSLGILHSPQLFPNDIGQPLPLRKTLLQLRHQSRVFLREGFGVFFEFFGADVAAGGEDVAVFGDLFHFSVRLRVHHAGTGNCRRCT